MGVGARVREHLASSTSRADVDDLVRNIGPFSIKISGCPNSCGQHHVADIGMTGLMVKGKDGVERPHYSLRVGGGCGPDARIGDRLDGRVPEEETPKVVAAIAKIFYRLRASAPQVVDELVVVLHSVFKEEAVTNVVVGHVVFNVSGNSCHAR